VPLSGIERVELLALLEIATLPEALPEAVGTNCAVKVTL
jgi:hypothetical protein